MLDIFQQYLFYSIEESKKIQLTKEELKEHIATNLYTKIDDSMYSLLESHRRILLMYLQGLLLEEMQAKLQLSVYEIKSDFYLAREDLLTKIDNKYGKDIVFYKYSLMWLIKDHNINPVSSSMAKLISNVENNKKENAVFLTKLMLKGKGIKVNQFPSDEFLFMKLLKFWDYKKNSDKRYKPMIADALHKIHNHSHS